MMKAKNIPRAHATMMECIVMLGGAIDKVISPTM